MYQFIVNNAAWFVAGLDWTQFADQIKMRLISLLINGILRVLEELIKYFIGNIILTAFLPPSSVEPVIFCF